MQSNGGGEKKMRTRKINADLMATKRVQRVHGSLEDLDSAAGVFNPSRLYGFDVPTSSSAMGEKAMKKAAEGKIPGKATKLVNDGDESITGPKLTSLKLPFLQNIFLEQGHKFSDSMVQQLDRIPDGKNDASLIPDPSKLQKHYTDSDLGEMVKDLGLKTSQEAITFFARHGSSTPLKFVNCVQPEIKDKTYRPYDLSIVGTKNTPPNHFVISAAGVVKVVTGQPSEFIAMPDWMREVNVFNTLRSIRFFKNYLVLKAIRSWRRRMHQTAYRERRAKLMDNLFLARETFCEPILNIQSALVDSLGKSKLIKEFPDPTDMTAFQEEQVKVRNECGRRLEASLDMCEKIVEQTCKTAKKQLRKLTEHDDKPEDDAFNNLIIGAQAKTKGMVDERLEREAKQKQAENCKEEVNLLGEFIRLADYIAVETFAQGLKVGCGKFLQNLRTRKAMKEMFTQVVVVADDPDGGEEPKLVFEPPMQAVQICLRTMWDQVCKVVNTVPPRLIQMSHLKQYLAFTPLASAHSLNVEQLVTSSEEWIEAIIRIRNTTRADFIALRDECKPALSHFFPLFVSDKSWDEASFEAKGGTVGSLGDSMAEQDQWLRDLEEKIKTLYQGGTTYYCKTEQFKSMLAPMADKRLNTMKRMMKKLYSTNSTAVRTRYEEQDKLVAARPASLQEFATYVEKLREVREIKETLTEEYKKVERMSYLLEHYGVELLPTEKLLLTNLKKAKKKFEKELTNALGYEQAQIRGRKVEVVKNIKQINVELKKVKASLVEAPYTDAKQEPANVMEELAKAKATIDDLLQRAEDANSHQTAFKVATVKFKEIEAVNELYDSKEKIWSSYDKFVKQTTGWDKAPFNKLNVLDMDQQVKETFSLASKLNKAEKNSAVTKKFKQMTQKWKGEMPMLVEIGSEAMKPKHWTQLWEKLDIEEIPLNELNVDRIRSELKMYDKRNLVSDIAGAAQGEYILEQKLVKIDKEWKDMAFEQTPYRESKKDFCLGDVEAVTTLIEDHQVNLQSMLGSPFIGIMQEEVEKWAKDLSFLSDLLDEWLLCQRNWMYLEPIFASDDIRKAMQKEAAMFKEVDRFFRKTQREVHKEPNVMKIIQDRAILDMFLSANKKLDKIQKELEDYLETKRAAFARFYFLSNDELLVILSQTRDPQAVQPHLLKCFDNIARLKFTDVRNSNEVTHMKSMKGEVVKFTEPIFTKGNPEVWLGEIEKMMQRTVRNQIKASLLDYPVGKRNRNDWFNRWPAMCILQSDMTMWTNNCMKALLEMQSGRDKNALKNFYEFSKEQIGTMVDRVRGKLTKLQRKLMSQLLIIDVHARDVVKDMVEDGVASISDFQWTKQMRYYWEGAGGDDDEEEGEDGKQSSKGTKVLKLGNIEPGQCQEGEESIIRQTNAKFKCSYEYQGCAGRLVITPLTDKCYLTLTGALHLHKGGAPAGPAGTGKTETVKDLAKSLAVKIVVFNCSDGLTAAFMARFFSGLSQCGAFCCFDEFNRIDIEVLSVIAEQILTIQQAIVQEKKEVMFSGRMIGVNPMFGVFITMNPGYAGRTELPDNLKALFRPVAMMIPDYALIAQIILFSEGFRDATTLSQKMAQLYRLSSEQLSKQDHYDFGMRAVKSVLVMAGSLKRNNPNQTEDVLLIRAMRDSNVPKFLDHDLPLFRGIISDLFPGINPPSVNYGALEETIKAELVKMELEASDNVKPFTDKVLQLHETMIVRHGVMVVGSTMSGKTTLITALEKALGTLAVVEAKKIKNPDDRTPEFKKVKKVVVNPKSVEMEELYGFEHPITQEWTDGLIGKITREFCEDSEDCKKWCLFDGPVDTLWIESMNTVLDDNKALCLGNGEVIKIPGTMSMVFENDSLSEASPATVSRCGMVYLEPLHLGWKPLIRTWKAEVKTVAPDEAKKVTAILMDEIGPIIEFIRTEGVERVRSVDKNLVRSCLGLLGALLVPDNGIDKYSDAEERHTLAKKYMFLAIIWSFGANLHDVSQKKFDALLKKNLLKNLAPDFPSEGTVYDYWIDIDEGKFIPWTDMIPEYEFDAKMPFFNILVPTEDTTKFKYLLELLTSNDICSKFIGETGVGKTVIVQNFFQDEKITEKFKYVPVTFSAQTTSQNLQDVLETKLVQKRKTLLGAPFGMKIVIFIDDVNMPTKEIYGAQPPIELMRQCIDQGGFYDRKKLFLRNITDILFVAACAPPGGGRSEITARATRHFHLIWEPQLSEKSMRNIFSLILGGYLELNAPDLVSMAGNIVEASVQTYVKMCQEMLPTPTKSHYTFNLRDLSKVVQGIMMADKKDLTDNKVLLKLWMHESARVFRDRLISIEDRKWFDGQCVERLTEKFEMKWKAKDFNGSLFGDYASGEKRYAPITDMEALPKALDEFLVEYNSSESNQMHLVFFQDAIMHMSRIARVLRQPRGNALLIGMGGSGRQSLTRFAAFLNDYQSKSIELKRGYGEVEWKEDLKSIMYTAGAEGEGIVFIFSDTQVVKESFLENINNILNSGEVPNLFEPEDLDKIINKIKPKLANEGMPVTRGNAYKFFIEQVRQNLHIVLTFSPVGDGFRSRCRQYPALVNCCTIDWFDAWPDEALFTVAERLLGAKPELELGDMTKNIANVCVTIHQSVNTATTEFLATQRRYNYTTPTSYLDLIKQYSKMLMEQKSIVSDKLSKYKNGLQKLADTEVLVGELKEKIIKMQPVLKKESEETAKLLETLKVEQADAKVQEQNCAGDAKACKKVQLRVEKQKNECQQDLDRALPAYNEAIAALDTLNSRDIGVMKGFPNPPSGVKKVMEAVCILFRDLPDVKGKTDWATSKKLLSNSKFIKMCQEYKKDEIASRILKKLKPYTEDKDLTKEELSKVSSAAVSLCLWAKAMYIYATVAKEIEPKREALKKAEGELKEAKDKLDVKMGALKEVQDKVRGLQQTYRKKIKQRDDLKKNIAQAEARLVRAGKLTGGLSSEAVRWKQTAIKLEKDTVNLTGNILLGAGFISYLGPFTAPFREKICKQWIKSCVSKTIPVDPSFSLVGVLSDPLIVRQWNIEGLPADNYSTENGLITTIGGRWPLMIDPQGQANRWTKNMGAKNKLQVVKQSNPKYLNILQNAISLGTPVLMENVEEELDAALDPVLRKQVFKKQGQMVLRFMDQDVPWSKKFSFFITTKLPNPHYMPEIFIKTTIVNFTVTPKGLEDQLLVEVCKLERADLEEKNDELILQIAADQQKLADIEKQILRMLSEAKGNILDNETLINTLAQSKVTSTAVKERVSEAEKVVATINITREKYRIVATRASILYFIIADLSLVDPMYQYSLVYFVQLYRMRINKSEKPKDPEDLKTRLDILLKDITLNMYVNICRGLFEKDKPLFSFLIAAKIQMGAGDITPSEFAFFIRAEEAKETKPKPQWIEEQKWRMLTTLETVMNKPDLITGDAKVLEGLRKIMDNDNPTTLPLPDALKSSLSEFQKLLVIKVIRKDVLTYLTEKYVLNTMGKMFTESPPMDLKGVYEDSDHRTPIIFVLSPGADPMGYLLKLARDQGIEESQFTYISLGQGQGPKAEALMKQAQESGGWVCLQNCHLSVSWLPKLEQVLEKAAKEDVHENYRLWLTSMPTSKFPVSILQQSIKVTNEPPKGLKANMKRTFLDLEESTFEGCSKPEIFKKLLFGLAFFHAVCQERRKFGAIGWNIPYEWMNSDLEVSISQLRMNLDEQDVVPWETLRYVIGEVNYGGRITDDKDIRLAAKILWITINEKALTKGYTYSSSGHYYPTEETKLADVIKYVENLPSLDKPEVFGLHDNANITYQLKESNALLNSIILTAPSAAAAGGGEGAKTPAQKVTEMAEEFERRLPKMLTKKGAHPDTFEGMNEGKNTLAVFLSQEIVKFNKLLSVIGKSLKDLKDAIKGLQVMSSELETIFNCFMLNRVPDLWALYPCLKPLGSWYNDMETRLRFMRGWLEKGPPKAYWIPGFFFPQGFMTSVLQRFARKTKIPIDTLRFRTEPLKIEDESKITETPARGAYAYGLFLQGAGWDLKQAKLRESDRNVLFSPMPPIWLDPITKKDWAQKDCFECPTYKTSIRAGTLTTTGHSSNFVLFMYLDTDVDPGHWIRRGVAMLCMLDT